MTTQSTWERRAKRAREQREHNLQRQIKRAELRPLRNAVNKALKDAGIPHSVTHYSSRVKGWPISVSDGWETESVIYEPPYIYAIVYAKNDQREEEYCQAAELKFLELFDYKRDGKKFQVFGFLSSKTAS